MKTMAGVSEEANIDLYADTEDIKRLATVTIKSEPNSEEMKHDSETDALFDSVVTSRINEIEAKTEMDNSTKTPDECVVSEGPGSGEIMSTMQKLHVYVGNLTWFTTDKEIENLLKEIGVEDLIDLKFFDNRINGQSKGYCNISVGSERSVCLIHEKLSKKEIHGARIVVAPPSKAAAAQFEAQSECKPRAAPSNGCNGGCNPRGPMVPGVVPPPPQPFGLPPGGPRMVGVPRRLPGPGEINSPTNSRMSGCPPHQHQGPPPPVPPHHLNYGPQRPHAMPPFHPHPRQFRPYHQPGHPPFPPTAIDHRHRGPPPPRGDWIRIPGPHCPPSANHQAAHCAPGPIVHPPQPQEILGSPPGVPLNEPPPAPHVNPAFFQGQYSSPAPVISAEVQSSKAAKEREHQVKVNSYSSQSAPSDENKQRNVRLHGMSESEIIEVVSRNRTVSSSAISRAVSDAAKGDFASAIETLVTAISLIKQSRVASDERCKILVTSLQDTLHGIESKSYGHVRVVHMRSKSRSRSRERASLRVYRSRYHHHRSSRSRSRGRSRSRDRYYSRSRRSRSMSSSRGPDFDRSSRYDEREHYHRDRDHHHDRERYKREHERVREHQHAHSNSKSSRTHERSEEHHEHDHSEQRSSSRR